MVKDHEDLPEETLADHSSVHQIVVKVMLILILVVTFVEEGEVGIRVARD